PRKIGAIAMHSHRHVLTHCVLGLLLAFGVNSPVVAGSPANSNPSASPSSPPGMVWIPGGEFTMGSALEIARADEKPEHRIRVEGFWMDTAEVTNKQFREFVDATGDLTTAEKAPDLHQILAPLPPGTPPPAADMLVPGSIVFVPPSAPGQSWWEWRKGVNWRQPDGPGSSLVGKEDHPVVQVSWFDAQAYAAWAGKRLPTE